MYSVIKTKLATKENGAGVYLSEMTYRNNRKQVRLHKESLEHAVCCLMVSASCFIFML